MRMSTCQAARRIGVSRSTQLRWFREGRVEEVGRARNGWRFFTPGDLTRRRAYADGQVLPPVRGSAESEVAG